MSRPALGTSQLASQPRRAVIKEPVWTWEIPSYFYTGGLAGASAILAALADGQGNAPLARRAWAAALAGVAASPLLLVSDLGRPARFFSMLRVVKVTSPMSVGTWILSASGASIALATAHAWTGLLPSAGRAGGVAAAALGAPLGTYTAALIADTAVPVWHDARHELPFVFAGSAAASAGAVLTAWTPAEHAGAARWATVGGAAAELAAIQVMEHRLGTLAQPYHEGAAGRLGMAAKALTVAGAAAIALGARRSRTAALAGGALVTAGSVCERWSVFKAGFPSAARPQDTLEPQRARIDRGETRGAVRRASPDGAGDPRAASPATRAGTPTGAVQDRPMATDVEIGRALNALTTTFNDQRTATFDEARAQKIVTGALGGRRTLLAFAEGRQAGWLVDSVGHRVARVEHTGTRWTARRERTMGGPLVPDPDG